MMTKEQAKDYLEKTLVQTCPPDKGEIANPYMAGVIDALADFNIISQEDRASLYFEYAE